MGADPEPMLEPESEPEIEPESDSQARVAHRPPAARPPRSLHQAPQERGTSRDPPLSSGALLP